MPHQHRRIKKHKKPQRTKPLGLTEDPEVLKLHRELAMLRIAGGAKPGKHKKKLLDERFKKLDEAQRKVEKHNGTDADNGSDQG